MVESAIASFDSVAEIPSSWLARICDEVIVAWLSKSNSPFSGWSATIVVSTFAEEETSWIPLIPLARISVPAVSTELFSNRTPFFPLC